MLCYYLRHIDLYAVYQQLPEYEWGNLRPSLANIPPPLCDALAIYFEELAEVAADGFPDFPDWRMWEHTEVAAKVSDLIESELDDLANSTSQQPPMADRKLTTRALDSLLSFADEARSNMECEKNYCALLCLLACQYDALCALYTCGDAASTLAVFESIAGTRETIVHCQELGNREYARRGQARALAAIRHKETNENRAAAIEQWNAAGHQFSSMRAFARNRFKDFGVTDYMTVYNWLRLARREANLEPD